LGRAYFWKQLCYKQLLNLKKGEEAGRKAVEYFTLAGDDVQVASVIKDTGLLYEHAGRYDKALELLNKSIDTVRDDKALQVVALCLAKKGKILSTLGQESDAEKYLLAAERLIDCTGNLSHQITVATHLSEYYVRAKELEKAEYYTEKVNELLKSFEKENGYLNNMRYSQNELAKTFIAQSRGKYKEASMRFRNFLKFGIRPSKEDK
jgi:tetratricopeptide (TPR) repeat protein